MAVSKRSSTDDKIESSNKRAKVGKNPAPPPVSDPGQRKSSKHTFLDDVTGFGGGLSLRHFINPQAAKLYNMIRVSTVAIQNLI